MIRALILNLFKASKKPYTSLEADTVGIMGEYTDATRQLDASTAELKKNLGQLTEAMKSLKEKRDKQTDQKSIQFYNNLIDRANEEWHLTNEQIAQATYQTSKRPMPLIDYEPHHKGL